MNHRFSLSLAVLCAGGLIAQCGDSGTSGGDDTPPTTNTYLAAGNYGDLIRYSLSDDRTYSYVNETTNDSGSGTYTMSADPSLAGVYEVSSGGKTFYVVELADNIMITSNPSGNPLNDLVVGIPSGLNLSTNYTAAELAGDYLFLGFEGSSSIYWGGYHMGANGTVTWGLVPDTMDPETNTSFDFQTYLSSGEEYGGGTWRVNTTDPSRITFVETVMAGVAPAVGTVYPGKAMLIDQGPAHGFCLGLSYPAAPLTKAQVAGRYRYIDVTRDGESGVGYFDLPATGNTVSYYYKYGPANTGNGTGTNYRVIPRVNNMLGCDEVISATQMYSTFFVVLSDGIMMHFCYEITDTSYTLFSYGVSAKLN